MVDQFRQFFGGGVIVVANPASKYMESAVHDKGKQILCITVIKNFRHRFFYIIFYLINDSFLEIFGFRLTQHDAEGFFIILYIFQECLNSL